MKNTYEGNVEITKENEKGWGAKLKGVQKITGDVCAYNGSKLELPNLAEVGGYVRAAYNGSITAPKLTEVGGDVWADNGSITAPKLTEVGGDVCADNGNKLELPNLAEVGGYVRAAYNGSKLELPKKIGNKPKPIRKSFEKSGFLFADSILSRIIGRRTSGKIMFWKTRKIGSKKILYVAQKGEVFSHGETPEKASHDLRYKLTDRDTTFCKGWTLDSVHGIEMIIKSYRAITGACEAGTKQFCEGKEIPERMSIKQAIECTKGEWGANRFEAFFNNKEIK
jgi:nitrogen fixation protein